MALARDIFKRSSRTLEDTSDALQSASECVQKSLARSSVKRTGMVLLAILGIGLLYWAGPEIRRYIKMERM
jgi:hypothetical protein